MSALRIGLVGMGKIARDQHLPAIRQLPEWHLVACADPYAELDGVAGYASLDAMLAGEPDLDAVALCTPTRARHALAVEALMAGKAVLLEKPPAATLSEVEDLVRVAQAGGAPLFAAWHSRFAPGVDRAAEWLARRRLKSVQVEWKEDVRVWHPGQPWIWEPGGMGVFDPGINALSILGRILPKPFFLQQAELDIPDNAQTPIAARLGFRDRDGQPIHAEFDFRQPSPPVWRIRVETTDGVLVLAEGGARLVIDGRVVLAEEEREYQRLYRYFAALVAQGRSDIDVAPLRHVADALTLGHRRQVAPFHA